MGKIKLTNLPIADSSEGALLYGVKNGESVAVKADSLTNADLNKKVENLHEEITLLSSNKELFEKAENLTNTSPNNSSRVRYYVSSCEIQRLGINNEILEEFTPVRFIGGLHDLPEETAKFYLRIKPNVPFELKRVILASKFQGPSFNKQEICSNMETPGDSSGDIDPIKIHSFIPDMDYDSMYLVKPRYSETKCLQTFSSEFNSNMLKEFPSSVMYGMTYSELGGKLCGYISRGSYSHYALDAFMCVSKNFILEAAYIDNGYVKLIFALRSESMEDLRNGYSPAGALYNSWFDLIFDNSNN